MAEHLSPEPDHFPGGLMVTDTDGRIDYVNHYLSQRLGLGSRQLCEHNIGDLLSGGSRIIYQTYLLPLVLHDRECEEIQMAMVDAAGGKLPVTLNARVDGHDRVWWCINSSVQRDQLDQQLIEARRLLEEKADELRHLSITDELTGLLNRRELRRRAEVLLASGERSSQPLSLAVLDIDYFKTINDEHGHSVGDRILAELGRVFQDQGRDADIIGRFGGEEFVFVLPDTDADQARSFALRLHAAISGIAVDAIRIAVSIGLVTNQGEADFDTLFKKADEAMYQAKEKGRNTTVVLGSSE